MSEVARQFRTHTVENQPPPIAPYDLWRSDLALREAVAREGGDWAEKELAGYGPVAGGELMELGFAANENKPKLRSFDRFGHRIDEIEFHPAWHRILSLNMSHGVHSFAWRNEARPGAHVARAALSFMAGQVEAGNGCPLTMTYASVPALRHQPDIANTWVPLVSSLEYDSRMIPAAHKKGCTVGMGMTEKQGGSDVRANTSKAVRQPDGSYEIVGHKWFFSAPMCDAHLVLAYAEGGLSCFLLPRLRPDGSLNAVHIQRLKDKLGDWSNASSEVEFHGAFAQRIGDEGRGVAVILEMVALTRQDCMIGSSALMRQAVAQAVHHAAHRKAFGKRLIEQPLMQNVLADLALEAEAAMALTLRVSRAVDASQRDPAEAAFARIATAIGKYWVCKRAPPLINEAQECLGGAGYVEESILPRLYRQAPLNSIWEGSGNIQCLDVLRALSKEPETREALFAELQRAKGGHPDFDRELAWLGKAFDDVATLEIRSRYVVERTALALQAAILLRAENRDVADTFSASRLGGQHGLAFGTLGAGTPVKALIERARAQ